MANINFGQSNQFFGTAAWQQVASEVSQTMNFINQFQAQQASTSTTPTSTSTGTTNNSSPYSSQQMAMLTMLQMQMMQMMQSLMGTMGQYNQSFPNYAMSPNDMLQQLMINSTPQTNPGMGLIKTAVNDPNNTNGTVSKTDVTNIETALSTHSVTPNQLTHAFQRYFANAPTSSLPAVSNLYTQLVEQGALPKVSNMLNPYFLSQLDSTRSQALSGALATAGFQTSNGTLNQSLAGYILTNLNSNNATEQSFAQQLTANMVQTWQSDQTSAAGQQMHTFLTGMVGIHYDANGNLLPDSQQPFPLSPIEASSTTA